MDEKHTCCICGQKFTGYGNNPYPVKSDDNARCCDICNDTVVIPARLEELQTVFENRYSFKEGD